MPEQRTMATTDVWEAPGPGTWERDRSHFTPTISRLMVDLMTEAAPQGIREGFELNSAPLETMDVRFVNGQMYRRLVPIIGGSRTSSSTPPAWLIRLVFGVIPRLRRRVRDAERALDGGPWRAELDRWEREWRPALIATNRRFALVDVTAASDDDLADHLDALIEHVRTAAILHFRLHVSDLGPIGLLLDHTGEWGLSAADVMSSLSGASPATSAPQVALRALAAELSEQGTDPASIESFDAIRSTSERATELLDAYLVDYGTRLTTGDDLTDLTLGELPVLVARLRPARRERADHRRLAVGCPAHRAARDRSPSRRARALGVIDHVFDLSRDELVGELRGGRTEGRGGRRSPRSATGPGLDDQSGPPRSGSRRTRPRLAPGSDAPDDASVGVGAGTARSRHESCVVTEQGGVLCHTAVIARELGIPAVVGAAGAMDIVDGATITIDPVAGSVTIDDPAPASTALA